MLRRIAAHLLLMAPMSSALLAQSPNDPHAVQPERPTVATHAGTVAPGWIEIEAGAERDRFNASTSQTLSPAVIKFGVASHVQLSVFGSAVHNDLATGVGDIGAGIKWRIADDAPIVGDFAVEPMAKFPTGSYAHGAGTGTTDASLLLISSHDLGGIALDVNAGYTRRSGDASRAPKNATLWTVAFGGPFAGPVGWVFECYGYPGTSGPAGQAPIVAILAGPTYLPAPWLALDVGLIEPAAGPQPHALYAGGVYNVGRFWHAARRANSSAETLQRFSRGYSETPAQSR
jgi:outer membrane putative beta-barrel porin/alpha-amylase